MDVHPRRIVNIGAERATHVSNTEFPGHYPDEDHSWNLAKFKQKLTVKVQRLSNRSIEFDLVGVDASIANALRRVMIAEVPTVAIEQVYIFNNTSIIHDEILASRIGLVPLNIDPRLMEMKADNGPTTDHNTLEFHINIECKAKQRTSRTGTKAEDLYENYELKAGHIVWQPAGEQIKHFSIDPSFDKSRVGPTNPDIVLAKLRPGQQVEMVLHAFKGFGRDHAKWSPVATASYRLHPFIKLTKPIPFKRAEEFAACFSKGVVKIDKAERKVKIDEEGMRNDTVSREVLRDPEFAKCVELGRIRDHFIFSVESESAYTPQAILPEAIVVLREKIKVMRQSAQSLADGGDGIVREEENDNHDAQGDVEMANA